MTVEIFESTSECDFHHHLCTIPEESNPVEPSLHPPSSIDGATVLYFAEVNAANRPTRYCRHIINGKTIGPVAALALCEMGEGFFLIGCCKNWNRVTRTFHPTL